MKYMYIYIYIICIYVLEYICIVFLTNNACCYIVSVKVKFSVFGLDKSISHNAVFTLHCPGNEATSP
jgi:hypothetical protein